MQKNTYKKIITHGGAFHADEVFAIAAIYHFHGFIPVERVMSVSKEDLEDPQILVLDIGREFNPSLSNFDHHQDTNSPATNILILEHFCHDERIKEVVKRKIFKYISDGDVGIIVDLTTPSITSIIANFNAFGNGGFELALSTAQNIFKAYYLNAIKYLESEAKWRERVEKRGAIAILHDIEEVVGWREFAERDGIMLFITPNVRGGYQIISRDSFLFQIPKHPKQTFLHNNGFIAVYDSFESALEHIDEILSNLG